MSNINLNRQQLAQFLPTHEAVVAFEKLFKLINENPDTLAAIEALIGSGKTFNPNPLIKRIEELEQIAFKKQSLTDVLKRLEQLEQLLLQRQNLSQLEQRIQNLEAISGI